MRLRRMTDDGICVFAEFLASLNTEDPLDLPDDIHTDLALSSEHEAILNVKQTRFERRFDIAKYFTEDLALGNVQGIDRDVGLWAWLSLLMFHSLCPRGRDRRQRPGEVARWILKREGWRFYRHLLAGPFYVYQAHRDDPERAIALLCGPAHMVSDVYLEIADSQALVTSKGVVQAVKRLYYDSTRRAIRKRVSRDYPGGVRRFAAIMHQLDATWDLQSLSADDIIEMLPPEFDHFKAHAQPA